MNTDAYDASIVIITYNNWSDTQLCLDSIFAKTEMPNFEVIVVDNASQDGTPEFLKEYAETHSNLRLKLNTRNEGFARANNQGAALARGVYLLFLNNDTLVTPGWLSRLIAHLQDPRVGMVGPVTNSASNESRILVDYESLDGLDAFAERYTSAHAGQAFEIRVLAFYCVAMRRSVFEETGPLDERFGLGMFEDDDYAMRLQKRGYRILCAEDVFIHHVGGKSFLKMDMADYWKLFRENRQKFEEKWGIKWQPHLPREELLRGYAMQMGEQIYALHWEAVERNKKLNFLQQQFTYYKHELDLIHSSRIWKTFQRIRMIREFFIPENSMRESVFLKGINLVKNIFSGPGVEQGRDAVPVLPVPWAADASAQDARTSPPDSHAYQVPILTPQFFDFSGEQLYVGGAERYLLALADLIQSLGYQPIIYQSAHERWTREYAGIPVIGLPSGGDPIRLNRIFHDEISPDALAIYFVFDLAYPMCNPRSIGISHGVYWDANNLIPLYEEKGRIENILNPIRNLARAVSVDTNTINWLRGIQTQLAEKFVYIPNFVDLEQFHAAAEKKADDQIVVLYPRRLNTARGFYLVKGVVADFLRRYPHLVFHFVGQSDPDAEVAVRELIRQFPGRVRWQTLSFGEMHRAYRSADITLIPTVNSEGTSLSCLEAMAAGNAVIASNVGGLPNLILSGYNGLLIEPTESSLREALDLLCRNTQLRDEFAARAPEVAKTFNIERWQASWTALLQKYLLQPRQNKRLPR